MNTPQIVITAVAVLALAGAAVAVYALRDDGAPDSTGQALLPVPTTPPAPTPTAEAPVEASATPLPDRTDCEDIRGTEYRSPSEREFFLASCTEPAAAATEAPPLDRVVAPSEGGGACETSIEIDTTRRDQTYDVTGLTLEEIAASLEANAPVIEGGPAFGLTEYSFGLTGSFCSSPQGACALGGITISADVTVTLPHLTTLDQLDAELAQAWTDYEQETSLHEDRHVRILEEGLEEARRQLLLLGTQPDCERLDREVDKVWTQAGGQIEQRQRAFHIADAQGSGGLVVP